MSIKQKLLAIAVFTTATIILEIVIQRFSIDKVMELNSNLVNIGRINGYMLELRKHEKDFIARLDLKYQGSFADTHAEAVAAVQVLKDSIDVDAVLQDAEIVEIAFGEYKTLFDKYIEEQKLIGLHSKDGLYGSLRAAVHAVEEDLVQLQDYQAQAGMLTLRRNEKDFMLRSDPKYVDTFKANLNNLKGYISSSSQRGDETTQSILDLSLIHI